jgi:hypothetical protein
MATCRVLSHELNEAFPSELTPGTAANVLRFKGLVKGATPHPGVRQALLQPDWHCSLMACALDIVTAINVVPTVRRHDRPGVLGMDVGCWRCALVMFKACRDKQ